MKKFREYVVEKNKLEGMDFTRVNLRANKKSAAELFGVKNDKERPVFKLN